MKAKTICNIKGKLLMILVTKKISNDVQHKEPDNVVARYIKLVPPVTWVHSHSTRIKAV